MESEDALREPYEKGRIALDILEPGDDEKDFGEFERVSKKLPPQVTSGMLYRDIVRIAWPSMLEIALTQLTSMADMAMVGRLGSWAITSVGLTTQPKFLLMIMFMAMNVGATALIARSKGEGDLQKANAILRQALLLTFVLAIVSSVLGFIFSESLVRFMGAQDAATIVGGTVYLRIQMVGFLFFALTTTITAALRGVGDSRTAMVYNMTANVVNVILNYCLIYGHFGFPRMEVAGASLATIIGQFVAFVMALYAVMRRSNYLHLSLRDGFKPRWDYMQGIFRIGIPALFEQAIMRAGMILFTKTVASLGTVAFATHQVCLNIQQLTFLNGQAFAVSATSLMGQSLGKKRPDMAQAYTSRTRRIGMTISIMLGIMFLIFRKEIITLYSNEPEVIIEGAKILLFVAFIQPFQSSQFILMGALRGAGDTRATAAIVFLTVLLVRPGLAIFNIHVMKMGLEGAWIAFGADQLIRSSLVLLRFNSGKWKRIKV